MPKIKIATTQSKVCDSAEMNGIEIRKLIRKGNLQGADIVHFCEGALSGYTKDQLSSYQQIDFTQIVIELEKIQTLCKQLNIWTVLGSAHQFSTDKKPHNSLYIISNNGEIVNRYDKRKCSHNELKNWYAPGYEPCYFEVKGIRFGCIICIEIQFPKLFIEAEKDEVNCILFSSYSKDAMYGIQAQGYAATNNYWISMSIPSNESIDISSRLIAPNGEIQYKCRRNCSSIVINEIDTESERWKGSLKVAKPWRKIAREGKIYEEKGIYPLK